MATDTDPIEAVFEVVASVAPEIRAGLPGRRTALDSENVTGDTQLAADVWADELLYDRLGEVEGIGEYASEERETVTDIGEGYAVALDPLDGSSNLRSNNPMGTVVGVYDGSLPTSGQDLVAAGFVLYGPITTMVIAQEGQPEGYVVEDGTRRSTGPVELPADPTVYGFGGRVPEWSEAFDEYVSEVQDELKLRYGGAMIADVSQVLTYGGIFGYPALSSRPNGKLRLLFESAPIAYVVEQAGGASTDGEQSLLDIEATDLHQRTPTFVGNESYIHRLEEAV
ncbi:class 1 fructose-bisphosphatase [Halodesulfurarchaeum sp. HSR-GB]|uniref:class 1 fructose-bisphosphatase n=1 Tax=Halodesulfurarchaeum sp. HSR-GB TaxID=3074077 RepID=UPI0028551B2F|nr:class 1 fructose-bisphosphatase [Halodesulfurarchaeum sp. HSR-GB]MDR5657069.1 class 1 fructose-bisphosphatase [Halodesulfurarchaeum sp. HSR-GB]